MIPAPPADCRRRSDWLFFLSLLPAAACVVLLLSGYGITAAIIFWSTFIVISIGTLVPQCAWFGPLVVRLSDKEARRQGRVWLTLDDGPDPATTPQILDLLDAHGALAGFFLIGEKARQHPELVREIARRGHLIGNHSQTHPVASFWALRPTRIWQEVAGCQETLTQILGTAPVWFRPPVGHHNLFLAPPLQALGLTLAMWDCRGYDGVEKNVPLILRRIAKDLRPGSIILLHDATSVCTEVLVGTLRLFQERGLKAGLPE